MKRRRGQGQDKFATKDGQWEALIYGGAQEGDQWDLTMREWLQ